MCWYWISHRQRSQDLPGNSRPRLGEVTATQEEAQAAADKKAQEEQDTEAQLEGSEEDAESEDAENVQQTEDDSTEEDDTQNPEQTKADPNSVNTGDE